MRDEEGLGDQIQNKLLLSLAAVYEKIMDGDETPETEKERLLILDKFNIIENIQMQAGSIIN